MQLVVTTPLAKEFFGFMVRRHREVLPAMTRAKLARRLGVTRELIVAVEHAEDYSLRHDQLTQMIDVLKLVGEKRIVAYMLAPVLTQEKQSQHHRRKPEVARYPTHRSVRR